MGFDDIVIGSGLAALGTVLGLSGRRRVLVIAGPLESRITYYDSGHTVPRAHLGLGGLGNHWHGVIPVGARGGIAMAPKEEFARLFRLFYPKTALDAKFGQPWLFVPKKAIRPKEQWRALEAARGGALRLVQETAIRFDVGDGHVTTTTDVGEHRGARLWICAGAMHSPILLDRSLGQKVARDTISDHVLCYLGQTNKDEVGHGPTVERTGEGLWIEAAYEAEGRALVTRRPARFKFRRLDFGIEQRMVFGMPTGSAMRKILRCMSPGLLAEALYNRFGLFPDSKTQSVYGQIRAADAYSFTTPDGPLKVRTSEISESIDAVRRRLRIDGLVPSGRPDLFLPGIHLHNSIDVPTMKRCGVGTEGSRVQVLDASVFDDIGAEHHSFKIMLHASSLARMLTA